MRRELAGAWLALAMSTQGPAAAAAPDDAVTLRVMTFNVWYGGEQVSLERRSARPYAPPTPTSSGVQEADRNLERIAEAAGMPYVDRRRRLLSRWPIFDSGSGIRTAAGPVAVLDDRLDPDALHAWVMVRPGKVVAVSNVHLSSSGLGADVRRQLAECCMRSARAAGTALGRLGCRMARPCS